MKLFLCYKSIISTLILLIFSQSPLLASAESTSQQKANQIGVPEGAMVHIDGDLGREINKIQSIHLLNSQKSVNEGGPTNLPGLPASALEFSGESSFE